MPDFEISEKLEKILGKLHRRDRARAEITLKKIGEIASSPNPEHYKNLSYSMKEFRRVHIDSHFVLIFRFDRKANLIRFEDLQHHDTIYRR